MIVSVEIIFESRTNSDDISYGLYKVKLNGSTYYLVRDGQFLGSIQYVRDYPEYGSIQPVSDNVKEELFKKLDENRENSNVVRTE